MCDAGSRQRPLDALLLREGVYFSHILSPSVEGPVWLPQLCDPGPSTGSPETLTSDVERQPEHPAPPARSHQAGTPSSPQLVASLPPVEGSTPVSSMVPAPISDNSGDGHGVGLPVELGASSLRGMVGEEKVPTHQLSGWSERLAQTSLFFSGMSVSFDMNNAAAVHCLHSLGTARSNPLLALSEDIFTMASCKTTSLSARYVTDRKKDWVEALFRFSGKSMGVAAWPIGVRVTLSPLRHPESGPVCLSTLSSSCSFFFFFFTLPTTRRRAGGSNTFTEEWKCWRYVYIFPPPATPILLKVMQALRFLKGRVLLIKPYWPVRPWFG